MTENRDGNLGRTRRGNEGTRGTAASGTCEANERLCHDWQRSTPFTVVSTGEPNSSKSFNVSKAKGNRI